MACPEASTERIEALDLWRGFALLGVCVVNFFVMNEASLTDERAQHLATAALDWRMEALVRSLFSNKAHTIFTVLFGIGIAIVLERAENGNARLIVRRMLVLLVLGIIHFLFFYENEVLHRYAIFGLLIVFLRSFVSLRSMMITGLLLAVFSKWMYEESEFLLRATGFEGLLNWPVIPETVAGGPGLPAVDQSDWSAYWKSNLDQALANWRNLGRYVATNMHLFGRVLIGYALWQSGFIRGALSLPVSRLIRPATVLVLLSIVLAVAERTLGGAGNGSASHALLNLVRHVEFLVLATTYLCLLLVVCKTDALTALRCLFVSVGRMSLTNYVIQTAGLIVIFQKVGLALAGQVGTFVAVILACLFFLFQSLFSLVWMRYWRQGPLEWGWRRLAELGGK